ncbi:MAG TPA: tetratricopeptide repeat protein [Bryobacteraceae bacterium]|jgi:serine/threonine-protein kinase
MRTATPREIRAQLEKLLASPLFERSKRMSRFLRFSVEHALAGTGDQVKEYLVGVEVFDRDSDYDPRVDPIVRVEARRLREKVNAYYESAGQADPVYIELPKGVYTPVFHLRDSRPVARAVSEPARTSIAVLPFANFSPQSGDDYFSDGLTEELILLLTQVQGLRVVAWHSASQFRGREQDLHSIRQQLNVDAALFGSVRRSPSRVRVTAQLIDTGSGAYLWSEGFDRHMHDVLSIQEEIAQAIVATLKLALRSPSALAPLPMKESRQASQAIETTAEKPVARRVAKRVNVECYNLCLQARFHARKRTSDGLRHSLDCYTEAISVDPESATAHAGLADAYSLLADYGILHPREAMPRAKAAAQRALELNPDSAEANTALAFIRSLYDWKWEEGEVLYRRAIALNPGYSQARHWFAVDFLAVLGRFAEADPQLQLARDLDPLSLVTHEGGAYLCLLRRDYDGCLKELEQIVALDADFYKIYSCQGRALSLMGKFEQAIAMLEKAHDAQPGTPKIISALGQTLATAGRTAEARACLDQLHSLARARYVPSTCFAIVHLGLGEHESSLEWLETACEQRELPLTMIRIHPLYDPLRAEPRFQALLPRMGFLP